MHLIEKIHYKYQQGQRLVAPLLGFPGIKMTNSSVKISGQNYKAHTQAIEQLYHRFKPDILFPLMDLTVEANALGAYTHFPEDDTPMTSAVKITDSFLSRVKNIDISCDSRALFYSQSIRSLKTLLPDSTCTGAYVIGPFTLAATLMEISEALLTTIVAPQKVHRLIIAILPAILKYTTMLINAGADLICVLEPSASLLNPSQFEEFSANYTRNIVNLSSQSQTDCIYHVCGNTMHLYQKMAASGVNGLSLDSAHTGVNLPEIAAHLDKNILLIGNTNPSGVILNGTSLQVKMEVEALLDSMKNYPNFILSTGCDLPLNTPTENINAFMQAGRNYHWKEGN